MRYFIDGFSVATVVVACLIAQPALAAPLCAKLLNSQDRPQIQDVQRALESLESPEERLLFYREEWGFDFLKPGNPYGTEKFLQDSYISPQPFYNKTNDRDGGIVMFRGHIFVDAYFRDQRGQVAEVKYTTAELAQRQIWFRWDPRTKTYSKEYGDMQVPLMEDLLQAGNGQVTLFRGLNEEQVQQLLRLKKGETQVLKELFTPHRDALFFTPDINAARKWSRGYFIEVILDRTHLKKSYVGIEYDYREIAIYDPTVLTQVVKNMKIHAHQAPEEDPVRHHVDSPD